MPTTKNDLVITREISRKVSPPMIAKKLRVSLIGLTILLLMQGCKVPQSLLDCRQLVVVVTPDWKASRGSLYCFMRSDADETWQSVRKPVPILLGRNGMGWGRGLHSSFCLNGPRKSEGDGRSPAGIFKLGEAFGFPSADKFSDLKIPYRPVTDILECIDDVNSSYYNKLIERKTGVEVDWRSSEKIIESPTAYYLSIIVEHNTENPVRGAGSCIFLHCHTLARDSTMGCTALDRPEMEDLVRWLDTTSRPVIVQLPLPVYRRFREKWQLPRIE